MERLTISIDSWQKIALEKKSCEQEISISELLRNVLTEFLSDKKPKNLLPLTETPDSELNEYDRAIKAWCKKELDKQAQWILKNT